MVRIDNKSFVVALEDGLGSRFLSGEFIFLSAYPSMENHAFRYTGSSDSLVDFVFYDVVKGLKVRIVVKDYKSFIELIEIL